jgi:2'-5' RNA ligase
MRTFIAVELSPAAKEHVAATARRWQAALDAQGAGAALRWTPASNLHLTLRFLGETGAEQRREIEAALGPLAAAVPAFTLALGHLGAFPSLRRPNVVWLALRGDLPPLTALQASIEAAARRAGFAAETRAFTPHLTIARAHKGASAALLGRAGEILRPGARLDGWTAGGGESGSGSGTGTGPQADGGGRGEPHAAAQGGPHTGALAGGDEVGAAPFGVTAVHLIHSDLRPSGPIYTPLASFGLG